MVSETSGSAHSPGRRPARVRVPFEVWALVAGGFAVALGYGVVAPALPQFALEFGVSNFAAAAIVSAFAFMRLIGAPFAGRLVNRLGERRTYLTGLIIVAVSSGACVFAGDYTQLLVLRAVGGIGSAMFSIAAAALLVKVSPIEARGRIASLNAAGFFSGSLLGPVFGALVAGYGLRAPFLFYFVTLLIAAGVVWAALRRSKLQINGGTQPGAIAATFRGAIRTPHYRVLLASVFSFGWASFGVRISVVPLFAAAVFSSGDPTIAAWILSAYAAGNALFIFPSGRWNDSYGRKPMLVIGTAIMAVTYFVFPASSELWMALAVMFAAGCGSALVNPGQQAVLADVLGFRTGGSVVAGYSMASDLGGVLGPLAAGAIVDLAGFGWAFAVTAAFLVLACLAWLSVPDSRRLGDARP